jgi:hypothetical protein
MEPNLAVIATALRASFAFLAMLKVGRGDATLGMQSIATVARGASFQFRRI